MKLRAHANVFDLAEERQAREQRRAADEGVRIEFIGWQAAPSDAPPATSGKRWRANSVWTVLRLGKRSRPS